jgi:ATP-dependent DNA ligase
MDFPILYHKGSKGEIRSWRIWTKGSTVNVEHGVIDGQKQISSWNCTPKNVGKKNATTGSQQAEIEAEAKHKYKLDRKYSLSIKEAKEPVFLPMLAHSFDKEKKKVKYPVFVQPKLDGVRALASWANGKVVLTSRSGKPYNVPHISKALEAIMAPDDVLDGEIYIHDKSLTFETLMSWIKRLQPNTQKLEYHVYDYPVVKSDDSLPYEIRESYLDKLRTQYKLPSYNSDKPGTIRIIGFCSKLYSEAAVLEQERLYVSRGYEGAIVRFPNGLYTFGYRSHDLLKVKSFQDEEFVVSGYEVEEVRKTIQGQEISQDCVVWVCKSNNGELFKVRPAATIEARAAQLETVKKNPKVFIGKQYKVKFQEKTEAGVPRFPVGLGFRLSEDK